MALNGVTTEGGCAKSWCRPVASSSRSWRIAVLEKVGGVVGVAAGGGGRGKRAAVVCCGRTMRGHSSAANVLARVSPRAEP